MKNIAKNIVDHAYTYESYRQHIDQLFAQGKTTGDNHSEAMLNYTSLNIARMNKWDKRAKLTPATLDRLAKIDRPVIWLVITEGWCGDAAQIVPVLHKMALENSNIQLRFILRDEHLDIMDAFLTNGGRSIPKVLILDAETLEVQRTWGPRPAEMQALVMDSKAKTLTITDETERSHFAQATTHQLHLWYAKDKGKTTQAEFLQEIS